MRVLLVEDEWLVAQEAQGVLEAKGHVIIGVANDTISALAIAADHVPELTLSTYICTTAAPARPSPGS